MRRNCCCWPSRRGLASACTCRSSTARPSYAFMLAGYTVALIDFPAGLGIPHRGRTAVKRLLVTVQSNERRSLCPESFKSPPFPRIRDAYDTSARASALPMTVGT